MNKQEMDDAIEEARDNFEARRQRIWRKYAVDNNTVEIGDIVESSQGRVKVDHMKPTFSYCAKYPEMLYYGPRLCVDGTPSKTGERLQIHQSALLATK